MGVSLTKSQCDKLFVESSTKVQQWPICALNHPHLLLWLWIPTHTVLDTITQGWEKGTARPYYPTRKQTWQSSHPYSSKSCWSIPRHYPKSKGIWGRSTYYTVINTGSNSCLIALFTGSSPVFFSQKRRKPGQFRHTHVDILCVTYVWFG